VGWAYCPPLLLLGLTGGQKPGFLREYCVTACSNGKNPVSWVYGWSETGFLPEKTRDSPQQRQQSGF